MAVKTTLTLLISAAAVLSALLLLVRLLENFITFHPTGELEFQPDEFGLKYEEAIIRVGQVDSLHGWYFPPADSAAPVLLVFHGNAGNISHRLDWLAPLVRRGLGALLFDYRGYGHSSGRPSEKNFNEEALAVWDWLTGSHEIDPRRLVAVGRSIGTSPATFLANNRTIGALIAEGAFTCGKDMARRIFGWLPLHLAARNKWEIRQGLCTVAVPVLLIHGERDRVVPFQLGEALRKNGTAGPLHWWAVPEGDHLDLHYVLGNTYYDRLEAFAREHATVRGY